jgi:transposase InsO family protein
MKAWRFTTLDEFVRYYNRERPHMVLEGLAPAEVYFK